MQKPGEFSAPGFTRPACGVIYNQIHSARQGMALGGIDTGYLSLETDGTLGVCPGGLVDRVMRAARKKP